MSRIRLLGATLDDFEDYYRIRCEPSDIFWMGHTSAPDYQMIYGVFSERLGSKTLSVVGDKVIYMAKDANGNTVGFTMLSITDTGIEIGISMFQIFQGCGLGTEIISETLFLALKHGNIVYARIRDDNIASQKIFIKNGFIRTDQFEMKQYPQVGYVAFRKYIYKINNISKQA